MQKNIRLLKADYGTKIALLSGRSIYHSFGFPMLRAALILSLLVFFSLPAHADQQTAQFGEGYTAYCNKDYQTALKLLQPLADQDNAEAQKLIGRMYWNARGVTKNYTEAAKWWLKAAELGDAEGQFLIAGLYRNGEGVQSDETEAFKWMRKAAEQGYAKAWTSLGTMYKYGEGVKQDKAEGMKWVWLAANHGEGAAQDQIATMYLEGDSTGKRDYVQAYKWFYLATAAGDPAGNSVLKILAKRMKPEQIAEAQRLAAEWKPSPAPLPKP